MNKRTFIVTSFIEPSKLDKDEQIKLLKKRKQDVAKAQVFYPHITISEDAYFAYCREHKIDFISLKDIHYINAEEQDRLKKEKSIKLLCPDCNTLTMTLDPLCPSCPEFIQGYRTSLLCSNCLKTTFSVKTVVALRNEYLNSLTVK
jgi:hypothetical protein